MQHRLLTEALLRGFGTAQELATAGGVSLDTAKRYRRGETYPDVFTLARLMRHSCMVVDALLRLAGLDDLSLDAEQVRLVSALVEIEIQRKARNEILAVAAAKAEARWASTGAVASRKDRPAARAASQTHPPGVISR